MKKLKLKNDPSAGMANWVVKTIYGHNEVDEWYCDTKKDVKKRIENEKRFLIGKIYVYRVHYDFREGYEVK